MKLFDAMNSGRPFKRQSWLHYMEGLHTARVSIEDLKADDYVLEPLDHRWIIRDDFLTSGTALMPIDGKLQEKVETLEKQVKKCFGTLDTQGREIIKLREKLDGQSVRLEILGRFVSWHRKDGHH